MSKNSRNSVLTIVLIIVAGLLSIIAVYLKKIYLGIRTSNPIVLQEQNQYSKNETVEDSTLIKLGAKRTVVQLNTFLPQIHLTLISVLQGLALGILIAQIESHFSITAENILLYINSLLIIVLVWYLYSSVFVIFMWPLSFLHTLLQFCLTIAQSISFLFISEPGAWTIGIAITALIAGIIRFANTQIVRPEIYERRDIFHLDMSFERQASIIFFILGVIFATTGFFQLQYASKILDITVATAVLVTILLLAFLTHKTNTVLMKMYFEKSIWSYEKGQVFEKNINASNQKTG
jgi:hypothetical protein